MENTLDIMQQRINWYKSKEKLLMLEGTKLKFLSLLHKMCKS